ncbi:MAG TPA: hypothetical protein VF581_00170 [Flavobacterium sp.]
MSFSCETDEPEQLGGGSTTIVGFSDSEYSSGFVTDGTEKPYAVQVGVIGGNQGLVPDSDITVSYAVVPSDDANAAIQGTHFDFAGTGNSVVIPAGSTFVEIPLTVYTEAMTIGTNRTFTIGLTTVTSQDDVIIASNYDEVTVTLVPLCYSNLAGSYTINYTSGAFPVTITEVEPGMYHSDVVMGWTAATGYEMTFRDVCGVLSFVDWSFQGSNPISGTGTVAENGNIIWTGVSISGVYENRNYTFVRNN